jgi:meromycolic acid enoyl-[acyl-carrier-protein] reductase
MGILDGKRILVTGVLMDTSIAFHVARIAQQEGAEVVLTSFGRTMRITQTIAKRLPTTPPVIELDASNAEDFDALADRVREHVDGLDGVLHSIGFAPEAALGGNFLRTEWADVATAVQISAYSLKALAVAAQPLMPGGGSVVGLTFDATIAWPKYDWMGVAKAALESTNRYLARDLGAKNVRCNLIAAGPIKSIAAKSIPGFEELADVWNHRAPIGWDLADPDPAGRGVVGLLSDFFPRTTGEIVHVDGGVHMMGA